MTTHAQTQPSEEEIAELKRLLAAGQLTMDYMGRFFTLKHGGLYTEYTRHDPTLDALLSALEAERAARVRAEAALETAKTHIAGLVHTSKRSKISPNLHTVPSGRLHAAARLLKRRATLNQENKDEQ